MKRVVSTTPGGMELEKLVPFTTVEHGDELKYSVAYTNHGDEPALAVKILLPIPKGVTLVAGSIERPGTTVSYSVDGGRTFAPLEDLTVTSAEGKLRPARITDVDTLRWKIDEPVPPGASGTVGCVVIFE